MAHQPLPSGARLYQLNTDDALCSCRSKPTHLVMRPATPAGRETDSQDVYIHIRAYCDTCSPYWSSGAKAQATANSWWRKLLTTA